MSWFFIALWAPFLLACANHNDKFVLSRYLKNKNIGSIVILSSLFSGVAVPIVWFFQSDVNDVTRRWLHDQRIGSASQPRAAHHQKRLGSAPPRTSANRRRTAVVVPAGNCSVAKKPCSRISTFGAGTFNCCHLRTTKSATWSPGKTVKLA